MAGGRFQFLSDLALGWFIYTPEGQKVGKKLISQLGKTVESEFKKYIPSTPTENKEKPNGNVKNDI